MYYGIRLLAKSFHFCCASLTDGCEFSFDGNVFKIAAVVFFSADFTAHNTCSPPFIFLFDMNTKKRCVLKRFVV